MRGGFRRVPFSRWDTLIRHWHSWTTPHKWGRPRWKVTTKGVSCWAFLGLGVSSSNRFNPETLFICSLTSSSSYPLRTKYVFRSKMWRDNPYLDGKSFLTARLDYRRCFSCSGMDDSCCGGVLMGVRGFTIKICNMTSLVIDDTCIEECNGLPGPLVGKLDGGMKWVELI